MWETSSPDGTRERRTATTVRARAVRLRCRASADKTGQERRALAKHQLAEQPHRVRLGVRSPAPFPPGQADLPGTQGRNRAPVPPSPGPAGLPRGVASGGQSAGRQDAYTQPRRDEPPGRVGVLAFEGDAGPETCFAGSVPSVSERRP